MSRIGRLLVVASLLAGACNKPSDEQGPAALSAPAPTASQQDATMTGALERPVSAPSTPVRAGTSRTWKGSYSSTGATLSVPPELSRTHWSDTQSSAGIGDGTLVVTVDADSGRARGEVQGVLGPADLEGVLADGRLAASVRRKDPADRGFTGTLLATVAGDHVDGTMSVSLGQASVLRIATFSLTSQGATQAPPAPPSSPGPR